MHAHSTTTHEVRLIFENLRSLQDTGPNVFAQILGQTLAASIDA